MIRPRLGLLLLALAHAACAQDDGFANRLTFGTGVAASGFVLTGAGTSFERDALGPQGLWFRLESAANFAGRDVALEIASGGVPVATVRRTPLQASGHILVSNFVPPAAGSYEVTARILADPPIDVASAALTLR